MAKRKTNRVSKNNNRSISMIVLLIIVVVVASSAVTLLLFKNASPEPFDVKRLSYDFEVVNEVSFVLDRDILHFGGGPLKARLQRGLNITTSKDALLKISWVGDGNIVVSENNFIILANETKSLLFYLDIPDDLLEGKYSGELIFEFYK